MHRDRSKEPCFRALPLSLTHPHRLPRQRPVGNGRWSRAFTGEIVSAGASGKGHRRCAGSRWDAARHTAGHAAVRGSLSAATQCLARVATGGRMGRAMRHADGPARVDCRQQSPGRGGCEGGGNLGGAGLSPCSGRGGPEPSGAATLHRRGRQRPGWGAPVGGT